MGILGFASWKSWVLLGGLGLLLGSFGVLLEPLGSVVGGLGVSWCGLRGGGLEPLLGKPWGSVGLLLGGLG